MALIERTLKAEMDIDRIADDLADTISLERALTFYDEIGARLELIAQFPMAHQEYPEAPAGMRRCPWGRWNIWYSILPTDGILVERVLPARMDQLPLLNS